jgi:hypothetical protein
MLIAAITPSQHQRNTYSNMIVYESNPIQKATVKITSSTSTITILPTARTVKTDKQGRDIYCEERTRMSRLD